MVETNLLGTVLDDRYRIEEKLGEGGMSAVYLATHLTLDRPVAIKVIRDNRIRAVFPEDQANPKVLAEIVRETGVKIGGDLIADGTSPKAHTFETMLKHNVQAIVAALKP